MSDSLPGKALSFLPRPYGFEGHLRMYGDGTNALRTPRLAQPRALKTGDIIATGDCVLSPPREGFNGSVLIHLTGGLDGHWIEVPARIPIALLTKEDGAPKELWKETCTCPKGCDCQNPPPDDWDGKTGGPYHLSDFCPIHNENPRPNPDCPFYGSGS